jgi:hypothetical protein
LNAQDFEEAGGLGARTKTSPPNRRTACRLERKFLKRSFIPDRKVLPEQQFSFYPPSQSARARGLEAASGMAKKNSSEDGA